MSGSTRRYERGNLTITLSCDDDWEVLAWTGSSDARDPTELLGPLLQQLTLELQGHRVILDFGGTEYMNSGTLSPMLDLIRGLDEASAEVIVRFSDDDWQLFFNRCVRTFSRTLRRVRVEGPPIG